MMWVFAILIVLAMGGVAAVAGGPRAADGRRSTTTAPDVARARGRSAHRGDLRRVRFSLAFRGYRMSEVDALLDRLAAQLRRRTRPKRHGRTRARVATTRRRKAHCAPCRRRDRLRPDRARGRGRGPHPHAHARRSGAAGRVFVGQGLLDCTRASASPRWWCGWSSWSPRRTPRPGGAAIGIVGLGLWWVTTAGRADDPGALAAEPRKHATEARQDRGPTAPGSRCWPTSGCWSAWSSSPWPTSPRRSERVRGLVAAVALALLGLVVPAPSYAEPNPTSWRRASSASPSAAARSRPGTSGDADRAQAAVRRRWC